MCFSTFLETFDLSLFRASFLSSKPHLVYNHTEKKAKSHFWQGTVVYIEIVKNSGTLMVASLLDTEN